MSDICGDNRFEIIEKAKKELLTSTNIENCPDEMAVIDNILFRMWQMRWLPKHGKWLYKEEIYGDSTWECSVCGEPYILLYGNPSENLYNYCPNCGARMDGDGE